MILEFCIGLGMLGTFIFGSLFHVFKAEGTRLALIKTVIVITILAWVVTGAILVGTATANFLYKPRFVESEGVK